MKIPFYIIITVFILFGCSCQPLRPSNIDQAITQTAVPQLSITALYPANEPNLSDQYPIIPTQMDVETSLLKPLAANTGFASISGKLVLQKSKIPLTNSRVVLVPAREIENSYYLPEIITSGFPELGDVIGSTDEQGSFQITDIKPGNYFLVVNFPDITLVGSKEGEEFLITLDRDQLIDLGVLFLE